VTQLASGVEGFGAKDVNVDKVQLVLWGHVDLEDGNGALSGEINSLQVNIERRRCRGLVHEVFNDSRDGFNGVDKFVRLV